MLIVVVIGGIGLIVVMEVANFSGVIPYTVRMIPTTIGVMALVVMLIATMIATISVPSS